MRIAYLLALLPALALAACGDDDDDSGGDGDADADGDGDSDGDGDGDADGDGDGDADGDADADADGDADVLYAPELLPEIEITIPPASWDALVADPYTYQPGSIRWGDWALDEVGVRLKGLGSFRDLEGKAAFKIKLDEFVDGQRLGHLRRLTLNNMEQDASLVTERLGYWLFREAGALAPRCNHARVFVNGEYFGLYANVESLDDEFAEANFSPAPGNLYDITGYESDVIPGGESGYELETNRDVNDTTDLTDLIEAVNGPIDSFMADAGAAVDMDQLLTVGAVQAVIDDWDGYFPGANNYKLYHDLSSGLFFVFPWGIDQSFTNESSDIYGSTGAPDLAGRRNGWLFLRCKRNAECLAEYEAAVSAAVDRMQALDLEVEMDRIIAQTADAIAEDTRRWYEDDWMVIQQDRVRSFLRARAAIVRAQLDGPLPELCGNDADDDGDGDFDCDDADCANVRCTL